MSYTSPFESTLQPFANVQQGINMILYGHNGIGKTPFIATSPGVVILNADPGGVNSAAAVGADGRYVNISTWDQMEEAEDFFTNHENAKKVKWVWLDSGPMFQDIGLEDIMVELVASKSHRKIWRPDKGEYGENMTRLQLFARHMCGLPVNFGITSFPAEDEGDDGETIMKPWFQGRGMIGKMCGMVDIICYMRIQEVKDATHQVAYFRTTGGFYARDRFGALPPRMVDPTIPKIESLINTKLSQNKPVKRAAKRVAKRAATNS